MTGVACREGCGLEARAGSVYASDLCRTRAADRARCERNKRATGFTRSKKTKAGLTPHRLGTRWKPGDVVAAGVLVRPRSGNGVWDVLRPCGHEAAWKPGRLGTVCGRCPRLPNARAGARLGGWILVAPESLDRQRHKWRWRARCVGCGFEAVREPCTLQGSRSCRKCFAARRRVWHVGSEVGGVRLLEQHRNERGGAKGDWRASCLTCGGIVEHVNPRTRASRGSRACAECAKKVRHANRLPRLCRTCGTTDERAFSRLATECSKCNRAACRNGRCACGRAIKKTRGGARSWLPLACVCANERATVLIEPSPW